MMNPLAGLIMQAFFILYESRSVLNEVRAGLHSVQDLLFCGRSPNSN